MKELSGPERPSDSERTTPDGSCLDISVLNRQRAIRVDVATLRRSIEVSLRALHITDAEVCAVLVSDRAIGRLNRKYLRRTGPTDVIAFALREGPGGDLSPSLLGDVVISVDTAARQARARATTLKHELNVLLVHGLLHLLGYDHTRDKNEARRMWSRQRSLVMLLSSPKARRSPNRRKSDKPECVRSR